ncbi:lipopolysaccharide biogenesis periplasmic protein AsmA [Acetobacter tropicalis NBRC 101654]|uniref:Lipopolysaccharide biogenesis periplasmic protein AsmA n=1 Tax=Acetobacter tropicalis NBRC 101654 TaxID=749388 RepID=F7VAX8_9PROT|nr:AsmA family protein [Acetobacter tropicalis]GAA07523.1 lipopolysaccharide biogenesis periplasmic protein AsmA [Acetobacter tropicalis NBRC 101654]
MRLKWKLGLLAGAAVLLVGGGSVVSSMQDANWMRVRLTEAVEARTGRHLAIDHLHVWILPFPWVEARGVRFSGVEEGGPDMLTAGEIRARLALMPLFHHRIVLNDVSIIEPHISVRRLVDGRADWHFAPRPETAQDTTPGKPSSGSMHWNLGVTGVHITKADVQWQDMLRHRSGWLPLDVVRASNLEGSKPEFEVKASKGKGQFLLTAQTGQLLRDAAQTLPVQARMTFTVDGHPAGLAHLDGTIADPDGKRAYTLNFGSSVGQLQTLETFFPHAALPDGQNISIDAIIGGQGDQPQVQGLHVRTGPVDASRLVPGAAINRMTLDATRPEDRLAVLVDGKLGAQALGLRGTVGTLAQITALALNPEQTDMPADLMIMDGASSLRVAGSLGGGRSTLDGHGVLDHLALGDGRPTVENLKVDGHVEAANTLALVHEHDVQQVIRGMTAAVDVQAPQVVWRGLTWTQVSAHVTVQNGKLTADPIKAEGSGVQQSGRFAYDASGAVPQVDMAAHPVVLPVEFVQEWTGAPALLQGAMTVVGAVSVQGADASTQRRTITGHIGASVVDGSIGGPALRTLLGPNVPLKGKMPVRCFGTHMQVGDGVARVDMLGLESDFLSLHGHGTVGLENQALDLHLSPRVALGGASAASDVRVTGTFAAPVPQMEPTYGGRYGINIGGDDGGGDNCPALLSSAREGGTGPAPSAPKAGKEGKVMNMLRGLGLFK